MKKANSTRRPKKQISSWTTKVLPTVIRKENTYSQLLGISRYRRIKCYMLIAACLDDWMDADILRAKSELLWQLERQKVTERGMHDT